MKESFQIITSRKHVRTKFAPNLHQTFSKNGENLGLNVIKIICCGDLLESPNRLPQHMIIRRTNDNYVNNLLESGLQ